MNLVITAGLDFRNGILISDPGEHFQIFRVSEITVQFVETRAILVLTDFATDLALIQE